MAEAPNYFCAHPDCSNSVHLDFQMAGNDGNVIRLTAPLPAGWQAKPVILCPDHRIIELSITITEGRA